MTEKLIEALARIDQEVKHTQVNKSTEYHLGQLRAKYAKISRQLTEMQQKTEIKSVQQHLIERSAAPDPNSLLEQMQFIQTDQNYELQFSNLVLKDNDIRIQTLQTIQQRGSFNNVQEEAGTYLCKFDTEKIIQDQAQATSLVCYQDLLQEERVQHMCKKILTFVLAYGENLFKKKFKKSHDLQYKMVLKSLLPFAGMNVQKDRIAAIFESVLKRQEFYDLFGICQQGIQLMQ
ncbi:Conserved_hypothetical protein [Hexamita inflata]|uniref:Uncharacterized protein n=1 Tax=Hexamita inflata TaxID=28002 RepID=A0AA86NVR4_9EUKA|nr:Conserved hypothetical protein [Hexamita inflata]